MTWSARLDQLQSWIFIFAAIAKITDFFAFFGVGPNPLHVHAEKPRVKIDAAVEITDQHHRVANAKSDVIDGFLAGHSVSLQTSNAQETSADKAEGSSRRSRDGWPMPDNDCRQR